MSQEWNTNVATTLAWAKKQQQLALPGDLARTLTAQGLFAIVASSCAVERDLLGAGTTPGLGSQDLCRTPYTRHTPRQSFTCSAIAHPGSPATRDRPDVNNILKKHGGAKDEAHWVHVAKVNLVTFCHSRSERVGEWGESNHLSDSHQVYSCFTVRCLTFCAFLVRFHLISPPGTGP